MITIEEFVEEIVKDIKQKKDKPTILRKIQEYFGLQGRGIFEGKDSVYFLNKLFACLMR